MMDGSKIPKFGTKPLLPKIKPPAIITRAFENQESQAGPSSSRNKPTLLPPGRQALRRRSKSTTDLRSDHRMWRPLKPTTVAMNTRPGQKRPAQKEADENTKPKMQKSTIPGWDIKGRFQELQKKYASLQDEVKQLKAERADISHVREEIALLKTTITNQNERITSLTADSTTLRQDKLSLNTQLATTNQQLQDLTSKCKAVQEANEETRLQLEATRATLDITRAKLESTRRTLQETELSAEKLKNETQRFQTEVEEQRRELREHEDMRRQMHNVIQDLKGNIRVFCRVRPCTYEESHKTLYSISYPTDSMVEIKKSKENIGCGKTNDARHEFQFDKVFPPEATQLEVFEDLAQLVQSALDGYHVCVFAYGQTGSGKTHTMQGTSDQQGMIPRTIDLLFQTITKLSHAGLVYKVTSSFLEIYNESIKDLLVPGSDYNYELRYNEGRGVTVTNLKVVDITSAAKLKDVMAEAQKNRAVAATDFNEHSSRSHAVTKIQLEGRNLDGNALFSGSISLVDLAGSESAKTSLTERLTETININKSLSALGKVMLALHNKDPHVPYRDSKLTFLLQSCLGGNSKTLMFVNIAPFDECFGESLNSLRFALKVKEVKTAARKNRGV